MTDQDWRWPGIRAALPAAPRTRRDAHAGTETDQRRSVPSTRVTQSTRVTLDTGYTPQSGAAAIEVPEYKAQRAAQQALCSNSGCAFVCTGLAVAHCCKRCERTAGSHGPKCEKRLRRCSTEGCVYAVTGLAPTCCRLCAESARRRDTHREHGPLCWLLAVDGDARPEGTRATTAAASGEPDVAQHSARLCALVEAYERNQAAIVANAMQIQALQDALPPARSIP